MNYDEALSYIHGRPRSTGAVPTLARIKELLGELHSPEKALKFVHIAGTNGKGSTAALIASALREAGYVTGLFTSPFLEDFRERIQINGELIPQADLCAFTALVQYVEDRRQAQGRDAANEFEVITAAAMEWFRSRGCDIVVLETGLGGRFDPTNAIEPPLAAVITHIAMDHTGILGDTIEKIAFQKAGIIKPGSEVIIAPNSPEALTVLENSCLEAGVRPVVCDKAQVQPLDASLEGSRLKMFDGAELFIPLLGRHQLDNTLAAYMTLLALNKKGLKISGEEIARGFAGVQWPARMEVISKKPLILLDSAHNPDGAEALTDTLKALLPGREITAVLGMMADKDWQGFVNIAAPVFTRIITASSGQPRSLSPQELAAYAGRFCPAEPADSPEAAIKAALATLPEKGALMVCGSVILAGQVRTILRSFSL